MVHIHLRLVTESEWLFKIRNRNFCAYLAKKILILTCPAQVPFKSEETPDGVLLGGLGQTSPGRVRQGIWILVQPKIHIQCTRNFLKRWPKIREN